jgi:hypothetical protein
MTYSYITPYIDCFPLKLVNKRYSSNIVDSGVKHHMYIGRGRMVVGFITTYATTKVVSSNLADAEVCLMQPYVDIIVKIRSNIILSRHLLTKHFNLSIL